MKTKKSFYLVSLLFLIFFFFISFQAWAQSSKGNISGVLRDASTGETLIGANVLIQGTSIGTSSDIDGSYSLPSVLPGEYTIIATYLGYEDQTKQITITAGQTSKLNFELQFSTLHLDEEIVITAQAEGQIGAINRQLQASSITNIISAKKIQEVPDANAAEAVGRLPGVSIVRNGGEGSKVVIRGLAPKYNKIQIEGVKMASTGNNDRSSDLSTISPYMLEGIEVSKAAMPDKEADVLGGSVNFILRSAPDKPKLDAIVQIGYNNLRNRFGDYKFVLGGSRRFYNKKLGVFFQADIENRQRSSDELKVNYFNKKNPEKQEDVDVSINNLILQDINRDINRLGGVAVIDYKIPNGEIKLSNFMSGIKKNQINRFENLRPALRDHYYGLQHTKSDLVIRNTTLKWKQTFGDFDLGVTFSNAYSRNNIPSKNTFSVFEPVAWDNQKKIKDPNNFDKEISYDIELPPNFLVLFANNDTDKAYVSDLSTENVTTKENQNAGELNISYNINFSDNFTVNFKSGVKIKQLTKSFDKNVDRSSIVFGTQSSKIRKLIAESYPEFGIDSNISKLPYQPFIDKDYSYDGFLDGNYTLTAIPNVKLTDNILETTKNLFFKDYPQSIKDDYSGTENYQAAYLMADTKIGKKITLIPGVRIEKNTTEYNGIRGNSEADLWFSSYLHYDTTTTRTNTFVLPMIHLKYKPIKWFDIRLAYTHTLTRPDFNKIVPSWNKDIQRVTYNNPYLLASLAKNLDAYASFYGSKLGLFTIGGFYKKIKNLIYSAGDAKIVDAKVLGLDDSDTNKDYEKIVNNKYPVNLYGAEFEWQTRFWYLSGNPHLAFLKGMVFNVNYTHTFSEVKYPKTEVKIEYIPTFKVQNIDTFYVDRLILQPNDLFNLTIGYDYKGFSIRGSMLYQNDIFSKTNFWEKHRATTDKYIKFDVSMKQKLPIDGMEVLLNLNNINSAIDRDINQGTGFPVREQHYGMTIDLGFRYRL